MGKYKFDEHGICIKVDKRKRVSQYKMYYSGILAHEHDAILYIHYGYGEKWENKTTQQMKRVEKNVYFCEIPNIGEEPPRFCLKNSHEHWDNNDGKDYIAKFTEGI